MPDYLAGAGITFWIGCKSDARRQRTILREGKQLRIFFRGEMNLMVRHCWDQSYILIICTFCWFPYLAVGGVPQVSNLG